MERSKVERATTGKLEGQSFLAMMGICLDKTIVTPFLGGGRWLVKRQFKGDKALPQVMQSALHLVLFCLEQFYLDCDSQLLVSRFFPRHLFFQHYFQDGFIRLDHAVMAELSHILDSFLGRIANNAVGILDIYSLE
jgi:hypothetical protein